MKQRAKPPKAPAAQPPALPATYRGLSPVRALILPLSFATALALLSALPSIRQNTTCFLSLLGAAGTLFALSAILLIRATASKRTFAIDVVLRRQHYLQACAQGSVLIYWGWYWREVYHSVPLIVAQLLFAYAFESLLTWSRRDTYTFGFGPFPVIFSISLFLWFKPDWFYLQFLMVAVGLAAKELIRWQKDGRSAHIFNPSSFPLGVFSLVLVITGTTRLTWGPEIASTLFYPPHIFLFIFAIGLVGGYLFGVTTMTMSAAVTMWVIGLLYHAWTGVYFFLDDYIPIAVFLGMHLLFTDPSTSPRSELGRIIFGMLYAVGVLAIYALLESIGAPTFYDKLLAVPVLNTMIQLIDRASRSTLLSKLDPGALGRTLTLQRRRLAYVSIWAVFFVVMSATKGVGDTVPGHWLPSWQHACAEGLPNACSVLARFEFTYCETGSGWACNDLGLISSAARSSNLPAPRPLFAEACARGSAAGCENERLAATGGQPQLRADPTLADYSILLREGKGPLPSLTPAEIYGRACEQGWRAGCDEMRRGGSPQ